MTGSAVLERVVYRTTTAPTSSSSGTSSTATRRCKTILPFQQQVMRTCQLRVTAPVQYGAKPNLGRYSSPTAPAANWFELLPRGDIAEARAAQVEAMEHATKDMCYVVEGMVDAGADGMDFDTTGGRRRRRPLGHAARRQAGSATRARTPASRSAGRRVRDRHARRARVGGPPAGRPCGRRASSRCARTPAPPSSGRRSTSARRSRCAWNTARSCTVIKPVHGRGHASPCTSTRARASAACR